MIKQIIAKAIPIIALVAFSMWFARDLEYEPFIGMILSVGGLIAAEKYSGFTKLNKWDERLVNTFLKDLPSSSFAIGVLCNHDFGGSFLSKEYDPLILFYNYWKDPDHQFNNRKLRNKMERFLSALKELHHLVGLYTAPASSRSDLQRIYPEDHSSEASEKANKINQKATAAYDAYTEFCELIKKYDFEPDGQPPSPSTSQDT